MQHWSIFGFLDINPLSSFQGINFIHKYKKSLEKIFIHDIIELVLKKETIHSLVTMAKRSHPFPCRTRKLSSSAPMVVGGSPPVRVGRRQANSRKEQLFRGLLFFVLVFWSGASGVGG